MRTIIAYLIVGIISFGKRDKKKECDMNLLNTLKPSPMLDIYLQPIQRFLDDKCLTEIAINRPGSLFTECKDGWKHYDIPELSFQHCRQLATLIASFNDKVIGNDSPILSATLPGGQRAQVILDPCSEQGTVSITIRKPSLADFSLSELRGFGAFDDFTISKSGLKEFEFVLKNLLAEKKIEDFLELAVKSNRNFVLCGQTGSGKSTVLRTLTNLIPKENRVISVEDVHEITLKEHKNKVHLFYGKNGITASQVIEATLRMKPDHILLCECRGGESWDFLSALDSDHSGMTTCHSSGCEEAFSRLAFLARTHEIGRTLPNDIIMNKLYSTIDVILYYKDKKLKEVYYEPERKYSC